MRRFRGLLLLLLASPSVAASEEIVMGVRRENGLVSIAPCGLQLKVSDRWEQAPREVASFPNQSGFMLGRRGLKDRNGHEVIPTLSVLWKKLTPAQMSADSEGKAVDPLMAYIMDNRPDVRSRDYRLNGMFIWQDSVLALKYAIACEFSAMLNKRPSRVVVIYTVNRDKDLGVQIAMEAPNEKFVEIESELMDILKSIVVTSPDVHGSREAFHNKVDDTVLIEFRDRAAGSEP